MGNKVLLGQMDYLIVKEMLHNLYLYHEEFMYQKWGGYHADFLRYIEGEITFEEREYRNLDVIVLQAYVKHIEDLIEERGVEK